MSHFNELYEHYSITTLSVNGLVVSHSYRAFPSLSYVEITLYNVPAPTGSNYFFVYDHVYNQNIFLYALKPQDMEKEILETVSFRIIVD